MTPRDLAFLRDRAALRRVALVAFAFALAGVLYALLAPRWYRSAVTVVPVKQQKGGLSSLLGGDLAGLASSLDGAGSGADAARVAAVLKSVSVTDAVIEAFDLRARYREEYQEYTRDELWDHCSVKTLSKPGLVELSCEDKDPEFVQRMLAFFAERGNEVFRRVSVGSASEEVRFLERRAKELRQAAEETASRMRAFQERHGVVDLESQSRAVVSSLASLEAQRVSKQLELEYARTYAGGDEATTRQLEQQLALVERKLRQLERATPQPEGDAAGTGSAAGGPSAPAVRGRGGVFPQALDVPRLRAEMEALLRDRKVAETTLFVALERLEAARAAEARDVSTFQILDAPTRPTRHSRPRGALTVAALGLLGLGLGVALEWARAEGLLRRRVPPAGAPGETPGAG